MAAGCLLCHGYQITLPYSKSCLNKDLNRENKALLFKNVDVPFSKTQSFVCPLYCLIYMIVK